MSPCCSHNVDHYFVICKKSLAQKLSDEFFGKIRVCDLL